MQWKDKDGADGMKKVSIIVPCYNTQDYIRECMDSLIGQTIGVESLGIIVVDDASTDGTLAVLLKYEDTLFTVLLLIYVGKYALCQEALYFYRLNEQGTMRSCMVNDFGQFDRTKVRSRCLSCAGREIFWRDITRLLKRQMTTK